MVLLTSVCLTGLEVRFIDFFIKNLTEAFAIREVSRQSKIDYKLTHSTIQKLTNKGILMKKRTANIDLCSLNLTGDTTGIHYVEMLRTKRFLDKHNNLRTFFTKFEEKAKTLYYTIVVFGGFAKDKITKTSDLDLLIITPTRNAGEEIERIINSEALFLGRRVQPIVLDEKEFIENLSAKRLNVVKEAFKSHIIITGVEAFYKGVKQTL